MSARASHAFEDSLPTVNRAVARMAVALTWLAVLPARGRAALRRAAVGEPRLAIESGPRGWALLEYEELVGSAIDYLGEPGVVKITIGDRSRYLADVRAAVAARTPTHYFYDPRTGSQHSLGAIGQAVALAWLFAWHGVTPIARVPDFAHRRWRTQCAIVTGAAGVATCVLSPEAVRGYFPHRRLVGPMVMALSGSRIQALAAMRADRAEPAAPRAVFTGSMYEPRTTFLLGLQEDLRSRGIALVIAGRELGSERDSNEDYWARLVDADVLVTTADQMTGPGLDTMGARHLVYRYCEALAAGSLLVAPVVPGSEYAFRAGVDYAAYSSLEDAADLVERYLLDTDARHRIAQSGASRMAELVSDHAYWRMIDAGLGARALNPEPDEYAL